MLCEAEWRKPGKYSGVVIFDRWGGCILYDATYLMYVSEKVKEEIRPYSGQAIQIDAKEVFQPVNPGDGRIGRFEYLGPVPETRNSLRFKDVRLSSKVQTQDDGKPVATIIIENEGNAPMTLFSRELALTLLTKHEGESRYFGPSDGPSFALITRQNFELRFVEPRWEGKGGANRWAYSWSIGKEHALPHEFTVAAKEKETIEVRFDLSDGQYDFLCGYGGERGDRCVASNVSGFDMVNGRAVAVSKKDR